MLDPQPAENVTPGCPALTTEFGTRLGLLLLTVKCSTPVPVTLSGCAAVLVLPLLAWSDSAVMVGVGSVAKAPSASIRPYPKTPSGTVAPSGVAPFCSAVAVCATLNVGNAPRNSAATAAALATEAEVP